VSPLLRPLRQGGYDVYSVVDPATTVTFGDQNAVSFTYGSRRIEAASERPGAPVIARVNWHPRWEAAIDSERAEADRLRDGYIGIAPDTPESQAELVYSMQPLDWAARVLALIGLLGLGRLLIRGGGKVTGDGAGILTRRAGRMGSHATRIGN
jgi:hypothetical protein